MKLSKSKLALAKVINENGGWPSDEANFAAQDKIDGESNDNTVSFYSGKVKPTRRADCSMWRCEDAGSHFIGYEKTIKRCKLLANWHQTCLSSEEYYQAYPKYDADGWIEWKGGECPVDGSSIVDVELNDGRILSGLAISFSWLHEWVSCNIIKYRKHKKPKVQPECLEQINLIIPASIDELCAKVTEENKHQHIDAKPTIERLAQDYRNAKRHAERLQKEAGDAAVKAESFAVEIRKKIIELQELIVISKPDQEPELVITDWRKLRAGDVVEITGSDNECWKEHYGMEMTVENVYPDDSGYGNQVDLLGESGGWCLGGNTTWRFIRRP